MGYLARALKEDAWLSLVYHRKDLKLWLDIKEMLKYIGFEYINCIAHHLGESVILNLRKTRMRRFEVVPELFEHSLFLDATSIGDKLAILKEEFELRKYNLWHIKRPEWSSSYKRRGN